MANLVDKTYYTDTFKGIKVRDSEFNDLSQRAEATLRSFVADTIPYWRMSAYDSLKENTAVKDAICYEIETLSQANGVQATTGGADGGLVEMFGGIPLAVNAKNLITQFLRENGLMYMGAV